MPSRVSTLGILMLVCASVHAQVVEPEQAPDHAELAAPVPYRLAEALHVERPVVLPSAVIAEAESIARLQQWNDNGNTPPRIGFRRILPQPVEVQLATQGNMAITRHQPEAVSIVRGSGNLVWSTEVRVAEAHSFRLHLSDVDLAPGTRLWIYGPDTEPVEFGTELIGPDGDIWTPTVFGDIGFLEVELSDGQHARFNIKDLVENLSQDLIGASLLGTGIQSPACIRDATCTTSSTFPDIDAARKAVAHLEFVSSGDSYVCSGGLLNDDDVEGFIPYLLTANHCLSTQSEVASLEAYWDYRTSSCNGPPPSLGSLSRSLGGTLLATGTASDFSFIRLNSVPSGRWYLGWNPNTSVIAAGVKIFRVSHPYPDGEFEPRPQSYSQTTVNLTSPECVGGDRPQFIYSNPADGAVAGGSSGSPAIIAGGYVVGQLYGSCPGIDDSCTETHRVTDGAFSTTYHRVRQWLRPAGAPPVANFTFSPANPTVGQPVSFTDTSSGNVTSWFWDFGDRTTSTTKNPTHAYTSAGNYTVTLTASGESGSASSTRQLTVTGQSFGCVANTTTLCLNSGRFRVSATWRKNDGSTGPGTAVPLTSDTGYFWFFSQSNIEVVTKVLRACGPPFNSYWVFAAGLTNLEVTLTYTDLSDGSVKTYTNPPGVALQPIQDTSAFLTCP